MDLNQIMTLNIPEGKVKKIIFPDGNIIDIEEQEYYNTYFTIESLEDNNEVILYGYNTTLEPNFYYSTDNGITWTVFQADENIPFVTLNTGDKVMLKHSGSISTVDATDAGNFIKPSKTYNILGNIQSLFWGDDFKGNTDWRDSQGLARFFMNADKLVSAEHLILPFTTSLYMGFMSMFKKCTSLTIPPKIRIKRITGNFCLREMFQQCTSLQRVAEICVEYISCTSGMYNMYNSCTSLTTVPVDYLSNIEYGGGGSHYFYCMFQWCSNLTNAPALPQTQNLVSNIYANMFQGCTKLEQAPALPATTLTTKCYRYMFGQCNSLTQAPVLPATTLTQECYQYMFYQCKNLEYIKMMATDISASNCMANWVYQVKSSGTFVKNSAATWTTTGVDGIPDNWTVETAAA